MFGVYFPGVYWCLVFFSWCILVYIFLVWRLVLSPQICSQKSWMNDGGEVSFDRIVSEIRLFYFKKKF